MSDRMLSDEILLGIINSKSGGGGGGGTDDYNDLKNQPQIGGNTLVGNKTASNLGLVAAEAGKGLSANNYTDEDKAIVGGVTAALAGKQGALTAGDYIKIDDDTISVNRWAVPAGKVVYTVITSDENYGQNVHVQRHTLGGALIDDRVYLVQSWQTKTVDDVISIEDQYAKYKITLLKDSDEQSAGYYYMVNPTTTPTSNSFTFTMPQEENDNDLIIREELDAKQDKTDNSLQTTDKTVVGAINEHEGDIDSLKSGLTNHENKNNVVIGWDNRNLWDEQGEQGIYNTETGEKGTGNNFRCKNYIPCEPETNYYMVKPNIGCYVLFYTSTKQFIRSISLNADTHVITTPENAKYITFYMFLAYGTTYNNDISFNADNTDTVYHKYHPVIGPAVEELQSGLTNYENQNNLNLDVPNRKNLFDPNSNLKLGFSNNIGTNGTFTSGDYYVYVVTKRSVPTFIISGADFTKMEDVSIRVFTSSSYPAVGVSEWRASNINELASKTVTLSENDKYLVFLIKWEDTATQADKEAIMVEEGDTATTYAPYIPSVESRIEAVESGLYGRKLLFETASIGTYADKLDSIFAVFNDLTESQKMRACITFYSTVLTISTSPNFSSLPYYESDDSAPRSYSAMLKNSGSTLHRFKYGASGTTVTDMSTQTANTTLKLYLLS